MNSLFIPPLCTFNSISSLENFEVRVRVWSATGQKARVRAKCVRAKVVRCEVRACGQKSVTPNTLQISAQSEHFWHCPKICIQLQIVKNAPNLLKFNMMYSLCELI